jgi:hypothetical protein
MISRTLGDTFQYTSAEDEDIANRYKDGHDGTMDGFLKNYDKKPQRGEWYEKLRKLLQDIDEDSETISKSTGREIARRTIDGILRGDKGVIAEATARTVFYQIRKIYNE